MNNGVEWHLNQEKRNKLQYGEDDWDIVEAYTFIGGVETFSHGVYLSCGTHCHRMAWGKWLNGLKEEMAGFIVGRSSTVPIIYLRSLRLKSL